ncbi:mitochondrial matrix Mmp37-domain-containing protein [Flagelloscypha sp. PMI_526]|nr:mitochondrial matrix Mmp37-domain-containing protein [Flagelloscypha sp. PMI_526]
MLRHVTPTHACRRSFVLSVIRRHLATEVQTPSPHSDVPPPGFPSPSSSSPPKRIGPRPRRSPPSRASLPQLPQGFGRNQLLPVSNSTRALLESIVSEFNAPIRYAFAYGSGVFEQDGYDLKDPKKQPMLDFIFAVTHPAHFHSINMHQHRSHYPLSARVFGSDYVARIGDISPGLWFNAYVPMKGVTIKYGVTSVDTLCSDLLNWRSLYMAGRMHKPLRIIKDDARVRLTQQVNLTSAIRAALLCLPETFTPFELFETIAAISYSGDPRMVLPAENKGKVGNIVRKQEQQFTELYHRLVVGLPGVQWPSGASKIYQDVAPQLRASHVQKLPSNLIQRVQARYGGSLKIELDENAYWNKIGGKEDLGRILREEMANIVRRPATIQSLKGIVSAGPSKAIRYSATKISKWWSSR